MRTKSTSGRKSYRILKFLIVSSLIIAPRLNLGAVKTEEAVILVPVEVPVKQISRDLFMERMEVYKLCKEMGVKYNYDPLMLLAQIEQESSYRETAVRLEQGYLVKYVMPAFPNETAMTKAVLASSFGFGQLMGHSLQQLGYFPNLDSVSVAMKIDEYTASPDQQVETMCQWLRHKQDMGNSHTLEDALRRYNGSSDYPPLVFARYERLKKEMV